MHAIKMIQVYIVQLIIVGCFASVLHVSAQEKPSLTAYDNACFTETNCLNQRWASLKKKFPFLTIHIALFDDRPLAAIALIFPATNDIQHYLINPDRAVLKNPLDPILQAIYELYRDEIEGTETIYQIHFMNKMNHQQERHSNIIYFGDEVVLKAAQIKSSQFNEENLGSNHQASFEYHEVKIKDNQRLTYGELAALRLNNLEKIFFSEQAPKSLRSTYDNHDRLNLVFSGIKGSGENLNSYGDSMFYNPLEEYIKIAFIVTTKQSLNQRP